MEPSSIPGQLPRVLKRVWIEVVALSVLSLMFFQIEVWRHKNPDTYRALSPPQMHFGDLTVYEQMFPSTFHTSAFFHQAFPFTYPAPVALIYEFFFSTFPQPVIAFLIFAALCFIIPALFFVQALRRRGIKPWAAWMFGATLVACSWPAVLIFDRANMEVAVWIVLAIAVWALATGRSYLAAICFGVAAALKLFPIVFLGLFLSMRRWRELAVGLLVFTAISIAGLALLGPTIPVAYRGIVAGLQFFQHHYMERWQPWENSVDHSLFSLTKWVAINCLHTPPTTRFDKALGVYTAVTAVGGIAIYFGRIQFLPLINQVLALTIASIYLTAFSGDGTLIHLYYSFALLSLLAISVARKNVEVRGLNQALYVIAFLVSYEAFFQHHGQRLDGEVKACALGCLFYLALRYPFGPEIRHFFPAPRSMPPLLRYFVPHDEGPLQGR